MDFCRPFGKCPNCGEFHSMVLENHADLAICEVDGYDSDEWTFDGDYEVWPFRGDEGVFPYDDEDRDDHKDDPEDCGVAEGYFPNRPEVWVFDGGEEVLMYDTDDDDVAPRDREGYVYPEHLRPYDPYDDENHENYGGYGGGNYADNVNGDYADYADYADYGGDYAGDGDEDENDNLWRYPLRAVDWRDEGCKGG